MIQRSFNLHLHAGHKVPLVINVNQYDSGEQWLFTLYNGAVQYTPSSGAIVGIKSDRLGIINSGTVDANGRVVINETRQMTAAVGRNVFELLIDNQTHGTANFTVLVEPRPGDNADLSESDYSLFEEAIQGTSATAIAGAVTDWMDENLSSPTNPVVDSSLTVTGAAADAKKTGDEISDLKSAIAQGSSLTSAIKSALLQIAQKVAYIDEDGQTYYDDLYDALYPPIVVTAITLSANSLSFGTLNSTQQLTATTTPSGGAVTWSSSNTSVATVSQIGVVTSVGYGNATITATAGSVSATCSVEIVQATLSSISAVYTQTGTVYNTGSLDSLKSDLVVTAHWDNTTTSTVASTDYTLSGTLTEGTSVITVSYDGKTTTFNVTVTQDIELPEGYTELEYVERTADNETQAYSTTGVTLNGTDTVVIEIGCMATNTPSASKSTGYFVGCRQNATGSTSVGYGLYVPTALTQIGTFDGTSCLIEPNGGNSIQNIKYDIVATKTPTGQTVTDGTTTQTTTETPRPMASAMTLFGIPNPGGDVTYAARGRIYYLRITEGGTVKANLIPAKRTSDNAVGFYDVVGEIFRTDSKYIAGPEV